MTILCILISYFIILIHFISSSASISIFYVYFLFILFSIICFYFLTCEIRKNFYTFYFFKCQLNSKQYSYYKYNNFQHTLAAVPEPQLSNKNKTGKSGLILLSASCSKHSIFYFFFNNSACFRVEFHFAPYLRRVKICFIFIKPVTAV